MLGGGALCNGWNDGLTEVPLVRCVAGGTPEGDLTDDRLPKARRREPCGGSNPAADDADKGASGILCETVSCLIGLGNNLEDVGVFALSKAESVAGLNG